MNSTPKKKPAQELRMGAIKAAIWDNSTPEATRHNVTFSRHYRDGEEWRSTDNFGRDDLLVLAKLADLAHSWIFEQQRAHSRSAAPEPPARA